MTGLLNRERIYLSLPVALQNAIVSLEGRRIVKRRYDAGFDMKLFVKTMPGKKGEVADL